MGNRSSDHFPFDRKKRQTLHSIGVGLVFFLILAGISKWIPGPLCPVRRFLGFSCPGCGLTRGFMAILRLDPGAAIACNPLSIPLFLGIVIYTVLAVLDVTFQCTFVAAMERVLANKYLLPIYVLLLIGVTLWNNR